MRLCHVTVALENNWHFAMPPMVFPAKWLLREKRRNSCHWLVENLLNPISMKHNPNVGSDASSVWNFAFVPQTDVISRREQWWPREIWSILSGCLVHFVISLIMLRYRLWNCTLTKKLYVNNKITARFFSNKYPSQHWKINFQSLLV